jgi:hypothetical protein
MVVNHPAKDVSLAFLILVAGGAPATVNTEIKLSNLF